MDRNEFLKICQRFQMLKNGICNIKKNVPDDLKVVYNNIIYFPVAYELSFDNKGNARHTAILKDLKANSIVYANLERIDKYERE